MEGKRTENDPLRSLRLCGAPYPAEDRDRESGEAQAWMKHG